MMWPRRPSDYQNGDSVNLNTAVSAPPVWPCIIDDRDSGSSFSWDVDAPFLGDSQFEDELSKNLNSADDVSITQPSLKASAKSPFTASAEDDTEEGNDDVDAPTWDVARGPRKQGKLGQLNMILPAVTKIALSTVSGLAATGGYMMGKFGERVGMHSKAVESVPFQVGFISWLVTNGIFPTLQYEPLGVAGKALADFHGIAEIPEKDIRQTGIIVCNHICYLDGIVLAALFRAPKVIAKADARHTPVLGKLMEEMEVIFVERGDGNSRQATLDAISSHCSEWKLGDRPLLIFPEGTTTNGENLLEFRKGAFTSGIPVRPVIIVYTGQWNPATTSYVQTSEMGEPEEFSDGEWGMQFLGHFIHSMHVRVLPPYVPSSEERADPNLYARNCREYMQTEQRRIKTELQRNFFAAAADTLLKDFSGYVNAVKTRWARPIVVSSEAAADVTLLVTTASPHDQSKLIEAVHATIIDPLVEQKQIHEFRITSDPPTHPSPYTFAASPNSHLFLQLTVPCPWPCSMHDLNRWAREIGQDAKIQVVN